MKKVIIGLGILFFILLISRCGGSSENTTVTIPQGSNLKQVATILDDADVINSRLLFRIRNKSDASRIQAGSFNIPDNSSNSEIIAIITSSSNLEEVRLTIPEGSTVIDIDRLLVKQGLITEGEFAKCAVECPLPDNNSYNSLVAAAPGRNPEGFLFPDTYFVNPGNFTTEQFFHLLLNTFAQKAPAELDYETVIMASIVEEEVRTDPDRAIVAGIYWKRLESGWRLEADATLLYENQDDRTITYQDLQGNSPYNTRKNHGFPPTPISNPGLAALEAAKNPRTTAYWFYLTPPGSSEVIYAESNEQHNVNKAIHL